MQKPTWLVAVALLGSPPGYSQTVNVSDFEDWRERSFEGNTNYTVVHDDTLGATLVAATRGEASAYYRQRSINLNITPCLSWHWKVDQGASAILDERSRAGDDYAARVYVIKRGGLAFWRARTINYVWSANQAAGQRWPNAYAGDNARMWAPNSGDEDLGNWVSHSRDIQQDWQEVFGDTITELDGIAIMTDGDDSGSELKASYARLHFSARNAEGGCSPPSI